MSPDLAASNYACTHLSDVFGTIHVPEWKTRRMFEKGKMREGRHFHLRTTLHPVLSSILVNCGKLHEVTEETTE
jgi:hypothetical protein